MNRTSLFVTTFAGLAGSARIVFPVGSVGSTSVPINPLLVPLRLTSVVGVIAGFPQRLPVLGPVVTVAHTSPAKMPTRVIGPLGLRKNGLDARAIVQQETEMKGWACY